MRTVLLAMTDSPADSSSDAEESFTFGSFTVEDTKEFKRNYNGLPTSNIKKHVSAQRVSLRGLREREREELEERGVHVETRTGPAPLLEGIHVCSMAFPVACCLRVELY